MIMLSVGNIVRLMTIILKLSRAVNGHARMLEPPGRSSMWRFGYGTAVNYNDNQLFCGGYRNTAVHDGKCGVCGDPYQGPWENESGGKYATGTIVRYYDSDAHVINITIDVSAHHRGHFEFRICPNNDVNKRAPHACFDDNLLVVREGKDQGNSTRYYPQKSGSHHLHLEIPNGLICSQCVLQWKYTTGNFWGTDNDGKSCIGCGPQELFVNCADIAIGDKGLYLLNNYTTDGNKSVIKSEYGYDSDENDDENNVDDGQQTYHDHHHLHHGSGHAHRSYPYVNAPQLKSKKPEECGRCYALPTWRHFPDMDNWCETNCKLGNCPPCRCYCGCPDLKFENPCAGKDDYNKHHQMADWCWRECCESECPKDKCACTVSVKYPASSAYHVQTKFFDIPAIHLFPGSQIASMRSGNKGISNANMIRHESEAENNIGKEHHDVKPAGDVLPLDVPAHPPQKALLEQSLLNTFWNKQWIQLSGDISAIDDVKTADNSHVIHNFNTNTSNAHNESMLSKQSDVDHSAHALGVRKLPNQVMHLPMFEDFSTNNLLVSEVPKSLLGNENDLKNMIELKTLIGNPKSKQSTGNSLKHGHTQSAGLDDSVTLLSNLQARATQIQEKQEYSRTPELQGVTHVKKTHGNDKNMLSVELLKDKSFIAKEELSLDKLIKIKKFDNEKHTPKKIGDNVNDKNTPYIVDVRLLNRILKSIKSWFDKPVYLVN